MKNKALEARIEAEIDELNRGYEDYHTKEIITPDEELLSGIERMTGMNMIADIGTSYRSKSLECCGTRQSMGNTFIHQYQAKLAGIRCWNSKVKVCPQCAIVARHPTLDEDTTKLIVKYRKAYVNWYQDKVRYENHLEVIAQKVAKKQHKKSVMAEIESLSTFEEKAVYFVKHIMNHGINRSSDIHYASNSLSKLMMGHILTSQKLDDWGDAFEHNAHTTIQNTMNGNKNSWRIG